MMLQRLGISDRNWNFLEISHTPWQHVAVGGIGLGWVGMGWDRVGRLGRSQPGPGAKVELEGGVVRGRDQDGGAGRCDGKQQVLCMAAGREGEREADARTKIEALCGTSPVDDQRAGVCRASMTGCHCSAG